MTSCRRRPDPPIRVVNQLPAGNISADNGAAEIDGAGPARIYFLITLPMLYLVMGLIGGLQTSGQVYVLTGGQGGPDCASIMIDTHLPLIIPNFFGGAFNIFLLRQTIIEDSPFLR